MAAVQLARHLGLEVFATVGGAEKAAVARELGCDVVVDRRAEDVVAAVKEATGGRGADVIYDPVGGDLAEPAFRSIAWRGRFLVVGFAQGKIPALPLNLMLLKGASMVGVFWGEFMRREPEAAAAGLAELARWHAEGRVKPAIDRRLAMRELQSAYARMGSRQVQGKVLLVND
jgi:NADPH2:quinone reductase